MANGEGFSEPTLNAFVSPAKLQRRSHTLRKSNEQARVRIHILWRMAKVSLPTLNAFVGFNDCGLD
jgi:hypothetical protein